MTKSIAIQPVNHVTGEIRPPGSKSITNRALVCAALADGRSSLTGVLQSDDTRVMIDSLQRLGIQVDAGATTQLTVAGCGGRLPKKQSQLFVGNSGTTVRFLTAMVAIGQGRCQLDGVPRMRERPIQDLIDALNQLGADVRSDLKTGCPPVTVNGRGLDGGQVIIRGDVSSQFLSGLLMSAPYARSSVTIDVQGELVSQPYARMTCQVMEAFGVPVMFQETHLEISNDHGYLATDYAIEPDASAASYFWGAAAITRGCVRVNGMTRESLQGDVQFVECLKQMGCDVTYGDQFIEVKGKTLRGIDVNMNAISDTVQTLAAVALFAEGSTTIRDVAHIRHKETDRIGDLARELRKFGAEIDEHDDGLTIRPGPLHGAIIDTYDDHRMAMSLALPGLQIPGVVINDPSCTAKTYPQFFSDLNSLCR